MGGHKIKVYDRDGKHLKVLTPFPADIAAGEGQGPGRLPDRRRRPGAARPQLGDAQLLPGQRRRARPGHAGAAPARPSTPRGASTGWSRARRWSPWTPTAASPTTPSSARGSCRTSRTCAWPASYHLYWSERPCLAVSSDDKYVYFAGLSAGAGDYKKAQPLPCVFRVDVDKRGPAEVFVGKLGQPGKEKDLLTAPRGLAVARGLLYVADPAANRVVAFKEADRSYAGEIAVENPQVIGVDPASGAVYVCAYTGTQTADLIKFSGLEERQRALPDEAAPHRLEPQRRAFTASPWTPRPSRCASGCRRSTPAPTRLHLHRGRRRQVRGQGRPAPPRTCGPRGRATSPSIACAARSTSRPTATSTYRLDDQTGEVKDVIDVSRCTGHGTGHPARPRPGRQPLRLHLEQGPVAASTARARPQTGTA